MPLWEATPLPNREDELFAAIITAESGRQLIAQVTSFQIAEDIVFKHNEVIPDDHPSAVAVRELQAAQHGVQPTQTVGAHMSTKEERRQALDALRASIKNSTFRYADIAACADVSAGWVGEVLRGNYPYSGACLLPKNIRIALEGYRFNIPEILVTF